MKKAREVVVAAACIALASCGGGGGGSNDQGNSFRALGVFQEVQEQFAPAADTLPSPGNAPGDSGRTIFIGIDTQVPTDINRDGDLDGGFIGVQNELANQSINVQGIQIEIFIPGSRLNNPIATDFVPLSISLGPAAVVEGQDATNLAFVQTIFVPADIIAFINQNLPLMPPLPFTMNVVMTVEAISDNGENFDSNEFSYAVTIARAAS